MTRSPLKLILTGLVLMLASWAAVFLSQIRILPMSLALGMVAHMVFVAGLFVGLMGLGSYLGKRHKDQE